MYMPEECNPFIKSMKIKFHDVYGIDKGCSSPNGLMFFNSIIWDTSHSLMYFFTLFFMPTQKKSLWTLWMVFWNLSDLPKGYHEDTLWSIA